LYLALDLKCTGETVDQQLGTEPKILPLIFAIMFKTLLHVATLLLCLAVVQSTAHPGHKGEINEVALFKKREYHSRTRQSLEKCARHFESNGLYTRAAQRRRETVHKYRRDLIIRDTDTVLNKSHLVTDPNIGPSTPEDILFSNNSTCILNPEGEVGPYYVPGELVRTDTREGQLGVPVILDGQFIDVETCEPIQDLWWDIWNCNATGVYSGVVADGNGNSADTSNINATFLRGIHKTDRDGVVQFWTIFPGHYSSRTTHYHVVAHLNATVLPNNTVAGGKVAHIGQLFWDQDLIYEVESTYPYNTNEISITTNADDHVVLAETEESNSDPMINYVRLGNSLSDGLFGWITIAVNRSATYDPSYSFVYTSYGGVAESGGSSNIVDP
jgi:protocatechuate 3,4-dioxygenase beta subunit